MKVVILNSPLFRQRNEFYDEDSLPPIGLGYIATHLENNGIEVDLIDAVDQRIPLDKLISKIDDLRPHFIAVNIFTTNYNLVKELIESITFDVHFIVGGLSTKELYKSILEWHTRNQIDIVIGDGEWITLDIVNDNLKESPFRSIAHRRVFKVDGSSNYFLRDVNDIALNRKFFLNEPVQHPFGFLEANIVASRGCIYNCTFCAAARSLNREYPIRERTNDSLIKELKEIKNNFPKVSSIRVLDDLFLKTNKCVQRAIDVFTNFDFQWRSMAHVMTFNKVDQLTIDALKKSGCNELFVGIESGSPKILSNINKTSNPVKIEENLTRVLKSGIDLKGYFIYGFPDETEKDMVMTFELAEKLKAVAAKHGSNFRTSVFQYRPYHGTEIYYKLKEQGKIKDVRNITANQELSHLVGRIQFNFHSGNYSAVDMDTVHSYIYRTTNLNEPGIFSQPRAKIKSKS